MDIYANQIRIDKFQKTIADFKEFFEQLKNCCKVDLEFEEGEDLSYHNDLAMEFIDTQNVVCFTIGDYDKGIRYYVSSVKCYPATWHEPPDMDTYDEVEFDNYFDAIREMIKRYVDFHIDGIAESKSELEISILEDYE